MLFKGKTCGMIREKGENIREKCRTENTVQKDDGAHSLCAIVLFCQKNQSLTGFIDRFT